jgi:hypothetical protein
MEGSVNSDRHKESRSPERKAEFSNGADAMGLWFAAIILCAVLTAGVIVYRTANSDIVTAANDLPSHSLPSTAGAATPQRH